MSKESKIADALKHCNDNTHPLQTWREQFAGQITFEQFRLWLAAARAMPTAVLDALPQCREMEDGAAFRECCPDYVSAEEFCQAAANQPAIAKTAKTIPKKNSVPTPE